MLLQSNNYNIEMNLDEFIGENIDLILDNSEEFIYNNISKKTKNEKNKKKNVSFNLNNCDNDKIYNNFDNSNNSDNFDNSNNSDNFDDSSELNDCDDYDDYDDDYDDFGFEYTNKHNDIANFDDFDKSYFEYDKMTNEDDCVDDVVDELYQNMYETKYDKIEILDIFKNIPNINSDITSTNNSTIESNTQHISEKFNKNVDLNIDSNKNIDLNEFENDNGYYSISLINIFIKYYNNKFDKTEHFFSGISNNEKDTSYQMELFYDALTEYKNIKKNFELDDNKCMKLIFEDIDLNSTKISDLFSKCENQIYMLDLGITRFLSPSLLICLNYIYENKIDDFQWNIYNLKNI